MLLLVKILNTNGEVASCEFHFPFSFSHHEEWTLNDMLARTDPGVCLLIYLFIGLLVLKQALTV